MSNEYDEPVHVQLITNCFVYALASVVCALESLFYALDGWVRLCAISAYTTVFKGESHSNDWSCRITNSFKQH